MSKVKIIDKKSINSIKYEREILSRIKHPLIINLYYSFQDFDNLYLVLDLLPGGDLRYHISHHRRQYFNEEQTKFFIINLLNALKYIHSKKIIHRDIKPENLVFDYKGYLHITDFGIAKFYNKNNSSDTSGTPGYMAPEVLAGKNHNYSVDYFAVGVIGYELMMGKRPYRGKNRKEIKQQIINKQIYIKENDIPFDWSFDSADFINKLLIRKDTNRLGYYNENEIFNHIWFKNVNWNIINNKIILAPYIPDNFRENFDKKYCEGLDLVGEKTKERYETYRKNYKYNNLFENFTFYNINMFDNYDKFNMNINLLKNKSTQIKIKSIKKTRSNSNILDNSKYKIVHNKNNSEIKNIKLNINNIKLIPKIQNKIQNNNNYNNNINIKLAIKKSNSLNNQHISNKSFDLKLKDNSKQYSINNINVKEYNSEKIGNLKYHSHSHSNVPKKNSIKLLNFNNTINSNPNLININLKNTTKIKLLQNSNNKNINKIPIPHSNIKIKNNQKIKIIKNIEKFILLDKSPNIKKINHKNSRPPSSQRSSIKKINLYLDKFNEQKICTFNNTTNHNSNQITDKNNCRNLNDEKTEINKIKSQRHYSNNYLINYLSNKNEQKIQNSPKVDLNCSNNNKNLIKITKINSFDKLNIKTYNSNEYSTASSSNKKK